MSCQDFGFQPISLSINDNAFNLVRKTQIITWPLLVKTGWSQRWVLGDWSEFVKGLEAASSGLWWEWWLSSFCQQMDHSTAAAASCKVTTCAGQEKALQALGLSDRRPSACDWAPSLSRSLPPFPLCSFHVDLNADVGLYDTSVPVDCDLQVYPSPLPLLLLKRKNFRGLCSDCAVLLMSCSRTGRKKRGSWEEKQTTGASVESLNLPLAWSLPQRRALMGWCAGL